MVLPKFIQISMLTTFHASLLNRDDSGQAKRIPFGGTIRTRISSQCLKRHWRTADDKWGLDSIPDLDLAIRSRRVFPEKIEKPLIEEGLDTAKVVNASKAIQKLFYESKKDDSKAKAKKDADNPETALSPMRSEIVVLGVPEVEFIKNVIRSYIKDSGDSSSPTTDKKKKSDSGKNAGADDYFVKSYKSSFEALKCGAGIDSALFGRFMSGDPDARVSAAMHVAHAFTVHEEESEVDYFTAVDDLAEDSGAGHINTTEIDSGIYYIYAVIDVPQLVSNLTGCSRAEWDKEDRTVAGKVVEHLLHLMATVTPGAKLGSTAPYARPWVILASAGDEQPFSLADAFYEAVPTGRDMKKKAILRMTDYIKKADAMYGTTDKRWVASMEDIDLPGAERVSLNAMGESLAKAISTLEL